LEKPRRVVGLEAVPDAEDGLDVLIRIPAQLLAQAPNVYVERTRPNFGSIAPHPHEQRLAGYDFPCVLNQQGQQIVLLTGQSNALGIQYGKLLIEIDGKMFVAI
jgi:hypothetical protein